MVSQTKKGRLIVARTRFGFAALAKTVSVAIPLLALLALSVALSGRPQSTTGARKLWDVGLEAANEAQQKKDAASGASNTSGERRPAYRADDTKMAPLQQTDTILGVTLWRLRPSVPTDEVTLAVITGSRQENWTPVRISPHETLGEQTKVRLTIEVPRTGRLYVINREIYEDGTQGEPYLIFPTLRTRGGDNAVIPGRIVDIPDQSDTPPYFTLRRNTPQHAGEVLTVILAAEPLPDVAILRTYAKLPEDLVRGWESKWTRAVETFYWDDSEGKQWTVAEQRAASGARLLVQDEPFPQTLYRIQARPGEPLLVNIPLKISGSRQAP
jgi:hypothetical protein